MATKVESGWRMETGAKAERTMGHMANRVRQAMRNTGLIHYANTVVASPRPYGNQSDAARRIAEWFRQWFSFVNDPVGIEVLRDPVQLVRDVQLQGYAMGDCDEAAMLSAAFGMVNGMPARFRALAFDFPDAPYTHVVTDLLTHGRDWITIDPTKPPQFRPGVNVTRQLVHTV